MSALRRGLTAVALGVTGTLVPVTAATAAPSRQGTAAPPSQTIGVRLLDVTAGLASDPRAHAYIVDFLPLGTTIHRRIEIANRTSSRQTIDLYPAAATISHGMFIGAAGSTPNELSTWTGIAPNAVSVPANATATATVTIAVPRNAPPGEGYGEVWAQTTPQASGGTLHIVSRVGIRMYLDVGTGAAPAANFTVVSLTAGRLPDDQPLVTALVRNTGGRAVDMSGRLQLTDGPGSLNAGPFPAALGTTLAPGQSEPVTIALNRQLPDGPWKATVTLRSGLIERSAQATIRFPSGPGTAAATPAAATSKAGSGRIITYALLAAALIVALAVIGILIRRRRHAR